MRTKSIDLVKRERVAQLLSREFGRFRDVVDALEGADSLTGVQGVFRQINSRLRAVDEIERAEVIELFAKTIGDTLLRRGASKEIVQDIQRQIRDNWLDILKSGSDPDVGIILRRAVNEWERLRSKLLKERKSFKDLWMGATRLTAGGGVIVFDAAKLLLVLPAPAYLFTSFISGAVLFMQGIDQLWGRNIDQR